MALAALPFNEQFERDGFALVSGVLSKVQIQQIVGLLEHLDNADSVRSRGGVFAIRNLLDVIPELSDLVASPVVRDLVSPILSKAAIPVRGILFDKTPGANWKVPWHQDVTIAVQDRVEQDGYGPWSVKAGVIHVQPPAHVLENMISVRLHLDPCGEENGALKVIPGSHQYGKMGERHVAEMAKTAAITICAAETGDALLMRPLLLHASSASETPAHRRVLHIDFAVVELPRGLRWAAAG